ncbi:MAG: hypothetical protein JST00_20590 [Deltaproteobacteria bacterium]|nr:hypothetical protein [Deltaproteobacteria bacterium]
MRRHRATSFVGLAGMALAASTACGQLLGIDELDVRDAGSSSIDASQGSPADSSAADGSDGSTVAIDAADADAAPTAKRVFVTTDRFRGDMGGLAGVDAKCKAAATRAGLTGTWIAWTSAGGATAIDRIVHAGRYERLDGIPIALTKAQLSSGVLLAPINRTEQNALADGDIKVWTGTRADGGAFLNCQEWSRADNVVVGILGTTGEWSAASSRWTDDNGQPALVGRACDYEARVYCFER